MWPWKCPEYFWSFIGHGRARFQSCPIDASVKVKIVHRSQFWTKPGCVNPYPPIYSRPPTLRRYIRVNPALWIQFLGIRTMIGAGGASQEKAGDDVQRYQAFFDKKASQATIIAIRSFCLGWLKEEFGWTVVFTWIVKNVKIGESITLGGGFLTDCLFAIAIL